MPAPKPRRIYERRGAFARRRRRRRLGRRFSADQSATATDSLLPASERYRRTSSVAVLDLKPHRAVPVGDYIAPVEYSRTSVEKLVGPILLGARRTGRDLTDTGRPQPRLISSPFNCEKRVLKVRTRGENCGPVDSIPPGRFAGPQPKERADERAAATRFIAFATNFPFFQ